MSESYETDAQLRALDTAILLDRLQFMRMAGITFNGARDTYELFGYDRIITAKQYRDTYARGGIAKRIVEAFPKATWRGGAEIFEDEDPEHITPFEQAWKDLEAKVHIWQRFQQVDILAGLSTYSVLLIGAPGSDLSAELPHGKPGQLLYVQPYSGGGGPGPNRQVQGDVNYVDATIWTFDTDVQSPRFGLPLLYQLRRTDITAPQLQVPVHWSRIIHVAEGTLDNDVYGQPTLENVWNLLSDLEKVTGGGAEAFFMRANAGMQVDVDKDMALPPTPDELSKLSSDVEAYKHNITRILRTRGININQLGSDVANFAAPADAIIKQIAGSKGIPMRILTGSEMGQLASGQDADNWITAVMDRRTGYAGPSIVRRFVDRLIEYGYLPTPRQYEVGWPVEGDLTEMERAQGAAQMAQVNATFGAIVFTGDEIRDKWYDFPPLEDIDTEPWRAELGAKMALTNKNEGAVIYTNDEIRKVTYGWAPLKPEDKVPLTAPERVTSTAPTPSVDAEGQPMPAKQTDLYTGLPRTPAPAPVINVPKPPVAKAAEDAELLAVLQAAIEANNVEVVDKVLGLTR